MKKLGVEKIGLVGVLLISCSVIFAQEKSKKELEKVITGEEPSKIKASIKRDFPTSSLYELDYFPSTLMTQYWSIKFDENKQHPHQYFQASLYCNHDLVEVLYEDNGRMISSKVREHFIDCSREIKNVVSSTYNGWTVNPIVERIEFPMAHHKTIYYAEIEKGHHAKKIALDEGGSVLKEFNLM